MTPGTAAAVLVLVFALAVVPDKYKPAWIYRLNWWQVLIGLVATVVALLIVANPEFFALGILGDSAFFDLLVLALGIQIQAILCRLGALLLTAIGRTVQFINLRIYVTGLVLALVVNDIALMVQKYAQRIFS